MTYDKVYALDTNIILNDANNIMELSEEGKNLIVLPETVLDEIDSKKSGFDELNYQARSFARLLQDAEIIEQNEYPESITVIKTKVKNAYIHIITKKIYKNENVDKHIKNDRKILEIIENIKSYETYNNIKFISLDIMARTRALSLGINTEPLNLGYKELDTSKDFHIEITLDDFNGEIRDIPEQKDYVCSIEIQNSKGRHYIYYKSKFNEWILIPEKNEHRLPVPPINKRQKIMSEFILEGNDINVISGVAGTGKTLIALSAAMRLIDLNKDLYKKIYYIRRTIISGTKEDELGFMPGTLEEKMSGYNTPMEDSIKKVAQLRKRNATKEEIEEMMERTKEKYDIEYLYAGHLRGSTLDDGSVLIIDEIQNMDISGIRTLISRVGKNSIVIAMGSNNQIDTKYLTQNTNALTFLMEKVHSKNESNVSIKGVKLTNVMRSKISEWADLELVR